ncbi:MAG: phosphotransferase [Akkermansiaceae bacterium]|nr:phosphotransferase [Akkermansiaceae bacterium]
MPTDAILSTARQFLEVDPTIPVTLEPIKRGASGRTIVRIKSPVHEPFIGIHWTDERADNKQFVPVAHFLKKARLRVPDILHESAKRRVALVEDLGDVDLLSLKDRPFSERLPFYRSALEQVDKLFYAKPPKDFELMPPFDAALYRWEQNYFIEHLVEDFLGMDATPLKGHPALAALAEKLGTGARHLVHRDFQSQNLLIKNGDVYLIDFQGLRRGRQEYDLASLVFDPYLNHSAGEREQLLALWEDIADERPETTLFHQCAAQRLMQALGAYGNILKNRGDEWYRPHIATAAKLLREVTAGTDLEKPLAPYLAAIP